MPVALPQHTRGVALELVRQLSRGDLWRGLHEQVYVVGLHEEVFDLNLKLRSLLSKEAIEVGSDLLNQYGYTVFWAPHKVIVQVANASGCMPKHNAVSIGLTLVQHNLSNMKEVLRDFLCRLKTTVPVPHT